MGNLPFGSLNEPVVNQSPQIQPGYSPPTAQPTAIPLNYSGKTVSTQPFSHSQIPRPGERVVPEGCAYELGKTVGGNFGNNGVNENLDVFNSNGNKSPLQYSNMNRDHSSSLESDLLKESVQLIEDKKGNKTNSTKSNFKFSLTDTLKMIDKKKKGFAELYDEKQKHEIIKLGDEITRNRITKERRDRLVEETDMKKVLKDRVYEQEHFLDHRWDKERVLAQYPEIKRKVLEVARKENVPPAVLWSLISTESGFDKKSESSADAVGLGQLRDIAIKQVIKLEKEKKEANPDAKIDNFKLNDKYDTNKNLIMSARYLKYRKSQADKDFPNFSELDRWKVAVSYYNSGDAFSLESRENFLILRN